MDHQLASNLLVGHSASSSAGRSWWRADGVAAEPLGDAVLVEGGSAVLYLGE